MLSFALELINEIRSTSASLKLQQVCMDFGDIALRTYSRQQPHVPLQAAGHPISWQALHRAYGRNQDGVPDIFEPHVYPEDLTWNSPADVLYRIEPALMFWRDNEYSGAVHDRAPISLNVLDAAVNAYNGLPYGSQWPGHMRAALGTELLTRYLTAEQLEKEILEQLEGRLGLMGGRTSDDLNSEDF
jgi:hypothetical protein